MLRYEQKVLNSPPRVAVRFSADDKAIVREWTCLGADAVARELALQAALVDGEGLCVLNLGADFIQMETSVARQIARMLTEAVRRVEELEQAERIAMDSAILLRAGSNFALSNNPKIIGEATKLAAWDGDLRRYMPGGVQSQEAMGTPSIIVHPPRKAH